MEGRGEVVKGYGGAGLGAGSQVMWWCGEVCDGAKGCDGGVGVREF